jgi:hypothetical protein
MPGVSAALSSVSGVDEDRTAKGMRDGVSQC